MKLPRLPGSTILLRIASVAALIALALIAWSLFAPTVIPVMVSMSVAQGIGTLSFLLYLVVIVRDLHLERHIRRSGEHRIARAEEKDT